MILPGLGGYLVFALRWLLTLIGFYVNNNFPSLSMMTWKQGTKTLKKPGFLFD
jgi:hypothetical protein